METFELRYFLGVARFENIHRASENLHISPGSLSKAISRLEEELGVPLFKREGRGIRLTDPGRLLQTKATEILALEESARLMISGSSGSIQCLIAGPEVLLSEMGMQVMIRLRKKYPRLRMEFHAVKEAEAVQGVETGTYHLALVTSDCPKALKGKALARPTFQTCVGEGHPLASKVAPGKSIPVAEVLAFAFASPSHGFLGEVGIRQSWDGWRDDHFPRTIEFITSSLSLLLQLTREGHAVAYLPDYLVKKHRLTPIKITGCPYSCRQEVKLIARNPQQSTWMASLF